MSDDRIPLLWKGQELTSMGAVMEAFNACKTEDEAREFIFAYEVLVPKLARKNLQFGCSYLELGRWEHLL